MELAELFSVAANGSTRSWRITPHEGKYTIVYGLVGGKMVTVTRECAVKNVGKANETSPLSQAKSEAHSKWKKKIDEGYCERLTRRDDTKSVKIVRHPVLPTLAQTYSQSSGMTFPCSVQPKLDGVRAIYHGGALWSRLGKVFSEVSDIANQLIDVKAVLDGELYCPDMTCQEIVAAVKKRNENTPRLIYFVFDTVNDDCFPKRSERVASLLAQKERPNVKALTTYRCETKDDVPKFMDSFRGKYEGLMLRSDIGGYVKRYRSKRLQKYKEFIDAEYAIVGFTEGKGTEQGLVIFTCECTPGGAQFNVRPMGNKEERREIFLHGSEYIGKMLTVKYQEFTDAGIPRFPVGVSIRDYE